MDPDITGNIARRKLRNPRLEIGGAVFPEECVREAEIRFAGDDHVRSRSAYVVLTPPAELRWDFKEEAKLYEDGDIILTGLCGRSQARERWDITSHPLRPLLETEQNIPRKLRNIRNVKQRKHALARKTDRP